MDTSPYSDLPVEQIYEQCSQVMHHISTHNGAAIDSQDLDVLVKTAILNMEKQYAAKEDQCLFGISPIEKDKYPSYVTNLQLHSILSPIVMKGPISVHNAVILDNALNQINKILENKIDIRSMLLSSHEEIPKNHQKLYKIIEKMFVLPCEKLDMALDKVLQSIDFNILGCVFCEPSSSLYFEKCVILEDMICKRIRVVTSANDMVFINSIFRNVATSRKSRDLYRECLKNNVFRDSIFEFFKMALQRFTSHSHERNVIENCFEDCIEMNMLYTFFISLKYRHPDDTKNILPTNCNDLLGYLSLLFERNVI